MVLVASSQAEDLQARINQLFGDQSKQQSAVGMKSNSLIPITDNDDGHLDTKKKSVGIDFNNPTVQNALQSLMKTGPNILDNLSRGSSQSSFSTSVTVAGSERNHADMEPDFVKPAKRAKPGKPAIAGFY